MMSFGPMKVSLKDFLAFLSDEIKIIQRKDIYKAAYRFEQSLRNENRSLPVYTSFGVVKYWPCFKEDCEYRSLEIAHELTLLLNLSILWQVDSKLTDSYSLSFLKKKREKNYQLL